MPILRIALIVSFVLFSGSMLSGFAAAQTSLRGIGETGKVELVQDGFQFLEGPAKAPDGSLYFTDIPAESIFRLTVNGEIELFLKPSMHANGLMYGGGNQLLACQMDGQLAAIDLRSKEIKVLTGQYQAARYNALNDLVLDHSGGIYFTDPRFRAPEPWPQGKEAFYYRSAAGVVSRLGDNLPAPNGIALSPDQKTLYVIPSMQAEMMAYQISEPGKIDAGRVFCKLEQAAGQTSGGGDGLTVDVRGNLYITSARGIQVFGPDGQALGTIPVPQQPANCVFGGTDNQTLFITARTGLYRVLMPVAGIIHRSE